MGARSARAREAGAGECAIQAVVRVRPLLKKESNKGEVNVLQVLGKNTLVLMDPEDVRAQSQRKRSCSPGSYQSR